MDKCGGPNHYATCLLHTPLVGVATGDIDSDFGSEDVDIEALVATCRRNLST